MRQLFAMRVYYVVVESARGRKKKKKSRRVLDGIRHDMALMFVNCFGNTASAKRQYACGGGPCIGFEMSRCVTVHAQAKKDNIRRVSIRANTKTKR